MTLSEFKFWLEGYSESFNGAPTLAQWNRVKARLLQVDVIKPATYRDRPENITLPLYPRLDEKPTTLKWL